MIKLPSQLFPTFFVFIIGALLITLDVAAQDDPDEQEYLVKTLVVQNAAALKKLDTMYVEFSWQSTSETPPNPRGSVPNVTMKSTGHTKIWKRGDFFHQNLDLEHVWPSSDRRNDVSCIIVGNDKYLAFFRKRNRSLDNYYFDNRASLYSPADTLMSVYPEPEILEFGFGGGSEMLSACFPRQQAYDPPMYRWSAEIQDFGKEQTYKLISEKIRGKSQGRFLEYIVDPDKGFLITNFKWFSSGGGIQLEIANELESLPGGLWFPKHSTATMPDGKATYTVNDVRIGDSIPDSRFTFESMEFDPSTTVMTEYSQGGLKRSRRVHWEGEWVPEGMLPKERLVEFEKSRIELEVGLKENGRSE